MDLGGKLQIKEGQKVKVLGAPKGLELGLPAAKGEADAVVLFVKDRAELKAKGKALFEAARADKLAWIAYPKAGQLGTDLDRDTLWKLVEPEGIRPVRQVAIDATWSALRFRPS